MNVIEIDKKLMRGKQPKVIMCNDVWVAGGSIRSWFNGWEKISDIDKNQYSQPP
jgi:orotate phosphoribosyltransferase